MFKVGDMVICSKCIVRDSSRHGNSLVHQVVLVIEVDHDSVHYPYKMENSKGYVTWGEAIPLTDLLKALL